MRWRRRVIEEALAEQAVLRLRIEQLELHVVELEMELARTGSRAAHPSARRQREPDDILAFLADLEWIRALPEHRYS